MVEKNNFYPLLSNVSSLIFCSFVEIGSLNKIVTIVSIFTRISIIVFVWIWSGFQAAIGKGVCRLSNNDEDSPS